MEAKHNAATSLRPDGDRLLDATLVQMDIDDAIRRIKAEVAWNTSDRNAITIYKTDGLSIVMIALHKNAVIAKHTASGIISVQVCEGEIQFATDEESVVLKKGQMIALHKRIPHTVTALQESAFLLTHATSAVK